jgi:hypothetical protein
MSIVQYLGNTKGIVYKNIGKLLLSNKGMVWNNLGTYEKWRDFDLIQKLEGLVIGDKIGLMSQLILRSMMVLLEM